MRRRKSVWSVAIAMLLTSVLVAAVGSGTASANSGDRPQASYTVTVRNITSGQYLTPPNIAAHTRDVRVFQQNRAASAGVQAVAENGMVGVLEDELTAAVDDAGFGVSGVGSPGVMGPLAPGEESTFTFTTNADRLSIVSMVICTNDGFAGLDSRSLPSRDGQTRTYRAQAYDAGTEENTELRADLVGAPFCGPGDGSPASNPDLAEDRPIRRHRTLRGVGDLDPSLDWRGPVAEVTVTRNPSPVTYHVQIENLTDGQYLTPPNYAFHDRSVRVFRPGRAASAGVQAVAENGGIDTLDAELKNAIDHAGLGTSGIGPGGPMGPLPPGQIVEFDVTTTGDRLSIVSMVICTNDGFAGLNSRTLPRWPGDSRNFYVQAYDAGTEENTELRADLVGAPFCGPGAGSPESNPDLAENSVIRRHRTLRGVGDLDPSLDWRGPVMKVTVTRLEATPEG